jgi:hypothetical protein
MRTLRQSAANFGLSRPCVMTSVRGEPVSVFSLLRRKEVEN